ncbi:MAG: hypothetical protein HOP11_04580 [Saprospiraceae bacterium]|nr:hypothetical protein [Saprospiraceae bacterium]
MKKLLFLACLFMIFACNEDSTTPDTDTEYWEIVSNRVYDTIPPGSDSYSATVLEGSIKMRYALSPDEWEFLCSYTSPPNRIRKTDKIPITMEVSILQNSGQQYSANGDFAIFFDRPEIEPGFVIAPISLKTETGVNSYIALTHRLGVPPAPASKLDVFIDGKALPTGVKGDRIAFLVAVGNGRNVGYKYIYEWKGK